MQVIDRRRHQSLCDAALHALFCTWP